MKTLGYGGVGKLKYGDGDCPDFFSEDFGIKWEQFKGPTGAPEGFAISNFY